LRDSCFYLDLESQVKDGKREPDFLKCSNKRSVVPSLAHTLHTYRYRALVCNGCGSGRFDVLTFARREIMTIIRVVRVFLCVVPPLNAYKICAHFSASALRHTVHTPITTIFFSYMYPPYIRTVRSLNKFRSVS
jgi:hypothetical protein